MIFKPNSLSMTGPWRWPTRPSEHQARAVAARAQLAETQAELESRQGELLDLLGRFDILRQQYETELARLDMVSEAGNLLGYFQVGRCVFCGADPDHQLA